MGVEHLGIPGRLPLPGEEASAALYDAADMLQAVAEQLLETLDLEEGNVNFEHLIRATMARISELSLAVYEDARRANIMSQYEAEAGAES